MPNSYAFDVYDNAYSTLQYLQQELESEDQGSKSVLIQETYYNDLTSNLDIGNAKSELGLPIRSIMQWPAARGSNLNYSVNYPLDYWEYFHYQYLNPLYPTQQPQFISGELTGSAPVCTIPSTATLCTKAFSWSAGGPANQVALQNGPVVFASGTSSGSGSVSWIQPMSYTFNLELVSNPQEILDQLTVTGLPMKGKLASTSSSNTCYLSPGKPTCDLTVFWSVPDGQEETISVYANGTLFAQESGSQTGSADAPWITTNPVSFTLYAGTKLLDTITLVGTTTPASPSPTISSAGSSGNQSLWLEGSGYTTGTSVVVRDTSWNVLNTYSGSALSLYLSQSPQVITLVLATTAERNALSSGGLILTVVNTAPGGGSDSIQIPAVP